MYGFAKTSSTKFYSKYLLYALVLDDTVSFAVATGFLFFLLTTMSFPSSGILELAFLFDLTGTIPSK